MTATRILFALALPLLVSCATPPPVAVEPPVRLTDQEVTAIRRCHERGGSYTRVDKVWHCIAPKAR